MLQLEKVSRFRKEPKDSNKLKNKNKCILYREQDKNCNQELNRTLEQHYNPQFIYEHFTTNNLQNDKSRVQGGLSQYFEKLYQQHYSIRQFQDSMRTLFLYRKKLLLKFTMTFFGLVSIFLSIWQSLVGPSQNMSILLNFQSVLTFFLLTMVLVKYEISEQLKKKQLLRQKYQNKWLKLFKLTAPQIILLSFHPCNLSSSWSVSIVEPLQHEYLPLKLNVIFEVLMQIRIYLVFSSVIDASIYCNTRAHRLCRIYSTKCSLLFGVKSLFQYQPLSFLVLLYGTTILVFGQMMTLSQGQYRLQNGGFSVFQNSLWFVIITMGTVGYGDYRPQTHIGRIISFSAAIVGIIFSSLLILTLSRYLSMSTGENKSHVTLKRLQLRKILQRYSKETIKFTAQLMFMEGTVREKEQSSDRQGILIDDDKKLHEKIEKKKRLDELRKKTEKVKFTIRRIKNLVDNDNLKQQIDCLFETLSESLNDIYKCQLQYAKLLEELYHQQASTIIEEQFCFTTQIQRIIKDR